jgi:hypothetical protein
VQGSARAYPESDVLKWRHDDTESRPLSIMGREIAPGDDPDSYIDLATKSHSNDEWFVLEFAQRHLRQIPLKAAPTYLHLEATGVDKQTGRSVPPCHIALLIEVRAGGGLAVTPKTLNECGFTQ